jgi:hypothetical protein
LEIAAVSVDGVLGVDQVAAILEQPLHAVLKVRSRPYYEAVAAREGFALLSIPIQFAAPVDAIAVDYPTKAATLRLIADLPSQRAFLLSLSNVVYRSPAVREVELWRVRKDSRAVSRSTCRLCCGSVQSRLHGF